MNYLQIGGLVLIFVVMYMLMIRPQRKRQKQLDEMRKNLTVGDKVTTIGGIKGTITKVTEEEVVVVVGADRVKLDLKRWAISTVDQPSAKKEDPKAASDKSMADREKELQEESSAPAKKPKRLGKKEEDDAPEDGKE